MEVNFVGIVKEVRVVSTSKGQPISHPFEVVSFFDRAVGGDIRILYGVGQSGYVVGQEVPVKAIVQGREKNFNVSYTFVQNLPSSEVPAPKSRN